MNRNILAIQGEMKGWYEPPHTLSTYNRSPIEIDMFRTRFSTIVDKMMFGTRDNYTELSLEPGGSSQFTFHTQTPNARREQSRLGLSNLGTIFSASAPRRCYTSIL